VEELLVLRGPVSSLNALMYHSGSEYLWSNAFCQLPLMRHLWKLKSRIASVRPECEHELHLVLLGVADDPVELGRAGLLVGVVRRVLAPLLPGRRASR